jgi:bifunctional polynucleotide phosphatase/kinase
MWGQNKHLLRYKIKTVKATSLVMLDLDHNLIKPKSGRKFPKDENDWKWLYPEVPDIVRELISDPTIRVVIISNQSGLKDTKLKNYKNKLEQIMNEIGKVEIYAATDLVYRKPSPLLFEEFLYFPYKKITMVGDAAGRDGDFSDSDRAFADNIAYVSKMNVSFKTPEEFFKNAPKPKYEWRTKFDPKLYLDRMKNFKPVEIKESKLTLYLLIGPPASGKSTLSKKINAIHISKDIDGKKTISKMKEALIKNKSVVIDNTNPSVESRKVYINAAKEINPDINVVAIVLGEDDINMAKHLNNMRIRNAMKAKQTPRIIPEIAYRIYKSKFRYPKKTEGIDKIIKFPIIFEFNSDQELQSFLLR